MLDTWLITHTHTHTHTHTCCRSGLCSRSSNALQASRCIHWNWTYSMHIKDIQWWSPTQLAQAVNQTACFVCASESKRTANLFSSNVLKLHREMHSKLSCIWATILPACAKGESAALVKLNHAKKALPCAKARWMTSTETALPSWLKLWLKKYDSWSLKLLARALLCPNSQFLQLWLSGRFAPGRGDSGGLEP